MLPNPAAKDTAEIVQAQLEKGGFKVTLLAQEIGKFVADWRASNFTAFVSLNGGGIDPDDYFYRTFYTGGSTNVFKYTDPELDKQLDAGRRHQQGRAQEDLRHRRRSRLPARARSPSWPTATCSPRCAPT